MRLGLRLSQKEFADQVEIKRQRLASYEEKRAPLRFDLALRICRQFIVSEKWLATGEGDARLLMDLSADHILNKIPPDTSFGKAYDDALGMRYEQLCKETGGLVRIDINPGDNFAFVKNLFLFMVERWCSMLSEDEIPGFLMQLIEVGVEVIRMRIQQGKLPDLHKFRDAKGDLHIADAIPIAPFEAVQLGLTDVHASVNSEDVKAQWPLLKKRLQKATAVKGGKSRLAEFLGEKLASVSQWLTDSTNAREPGAETALRMLNWVERQERK